MFNIKEPNINIGNEISNKSFELVIKEASEYEKFNEFSEDEKDIVVRLIHTTTCFEQILDNIYFSKNSTTKIKELLANEAKIIVDTNMIKSGLSDFYLKKYNNDVICYVNEPRVYDMAKEENTTRSYSAVKLAIQENKDKPMILACGNAPTFIYSAIKTLIEEKVDLSNIALLIFPVGFVNVVESKEYTKEFMNHFGVEGIILDGRYGASTMIVASLHSAYKLIKDYDGKNKYNGK
jgi:precorrin-8X/cobalt-precorrin-8 methylmutase